LSRPGRPRRGKVERPTGRTTLPRRGRSGGLWCATGRRRGWCWGPLPCVPGSRGRAPGRRRPVPGS